MKNLITKYLIIGLILSSLHGFSQLRTVEFNQLDSLQKEKPRTTLVFIHTDWCKFCAAMENTTFQNSEIIKSLNEKYYFISFDAESKDDIKLKGNTFRFQPSGNNTGTHELATQLGTINGELSFPSLCFLNSNYEIIFQHNQFINSKDLLTVLTGLQEK